MSTSPVSFPLTPGFRGFVAGVVNAGHHQQVRLEVLDPANNNQVLASATFRGQGTRVHMRDIINNREHWSFGPFSFNATVRVTISHSRTGDNFTNSKMVGPLTINKAPEPDYPMTFISTTVISEDLQDASHDDATVVVLQYK